MNAASLDRSADQLRLRIGYVQTTPEFGHIEGNIDAVRDQIADLMRSSRADIVVLPELAFTGYCFTSKEETARYAESLPSGATAAALLDICRRHDICLVCGLAELDNGRVYNSAVAVAPEGVLCVYRKVHLFDQEIELFEPGDVGFPVFQWRGARIGMMICFDWVFPESVRELALGGADLIAHPANLVLPYCQQAIRTRCLENRVFAVTANRAGRERHGTRDLTFTGLSQITAPDGAVLAQAGVERGEAAAVAIDLGRARNKWFTVRNHLLHNRRPDQYNRLAGRLMPADWDGRPE